MKTFVDVISPTLTSPRTQLDVNFKMGPLDDNVQFVEGDTQAFVKNADFTVRMTVKSAKKLRKKLKAAIEATL